MMKFKVFFILSLICNFTYSQKPFEFRCDLVGGEGNDFDPAVLGTSDGGIILFIQTTESVPNIQPDSASGNFITEENAGLEDIWMVRLDSDNNILWDKMLGGSHNEQKPEVIETSDGGFLLVCGSESSNSGDVTGSSNGWMDIWVVKLSNNGLIEWNKLFGGSGYEYRPKVVEANNGDFIIACESSYSGISGDISDAGNGDYDIWIFRIDPNGNLLWDKMYGGSNSDYLPSILKASSGGYLVGCHSESNYSGDITDNNNGFWDIWVFKIDEDGNIEWNNLYGGNQGEYLPQFLNAPDGGYLIGAISQSSNSGDVTDSSNGSDDLWLIKINAIGQIEWNELYGGSNAPIDISMANSKDNGYLIASIENSGKSGDITDESNGQTDVWLLKIDANGQILWDNLIGGDKAEMTPCLRSTSDDNYILACSTSSSNSGDIIDNNYGADDIWVVRIYDTGIDNLLPFGNFCDDNCFINLDSVGNDGSKHKQIISNNKISAKSDIQNNNLSISGKEIKLEAGFSVSNGISFSAKIDNCIKPPGQYTILNNKISPQISNNSINQLKLGRNLLTSFQTYPNPSTSNTITVKFNLESSKKLSMRLRNIEGNIIKYFFKDNIFYLGYNTLTLNIDRKGFYILEIYDEFKYYYSKIIML